MQHQSKQFKYSHKCQNILCNVEFGSNRKHSKTCSPRCKMALSRSKKQSQDTKRLYRFETSPFAHSLARQCIRAGTVQVVLKDAELLVELHQILKLASRADGYGATKDYAIAHLHPVRGFHSVGTLHPKNLVVSDRTANAEHRNTLPAKGIGHSILRCHLESRWQVSPEASPSSVIKILVQYLGESFCQQLAVKLKLQPATRAKYLDQLSPYMAHEAVKAAGCLDDVTTPNLGKLVALVTGKKAGSFSADCFGMNPGEVFMAESKRLSKYYPHLAEAHDSYLEKHDSCSGLFVHAWLGEKAAVKRLDELCKSMFDLFHGAISLKAFAHALDTTVLPFPKEENTPSNDESLCLVTTSVFSEDDYSEMTHSVSLEVLEQAAGMQAYLYDEDVPEFSEAELEAAFHGVGHKQKTPQTAFARFLSG